MMIADMDTAEVSTALLTAMLTWSGGASSAEGNGNRYKVAREGFV